MPDQFESNRDRMQARERVGIGGAYGEKRKILLGHHPAPQIIPFDKGVVLDEDIPTTKDTWPLTATLRFEKVLGTIVNRREIVLRFEKPVTNLMFFNIGKFWANDANSTTIVEIKFKLILANLFTGIHALETWDWDGNNFDDNSDFYIGTGNADRWMSTLNGIHTEVYINFSSNVESVLKASAAIGEYTVDGEGKPVQEVLDAPPVTGVHLYVNKAATIMGNDGNYSGSPGDRPGNIDPLIPTWFGIDVDLLAVKPIT